jgi:hypothetical protein
LAGREQCSLGPPRERLGPHPGEHLERGAQFLPRLIEATLTMQPLSKEKVCARQFQAETGPAQPFNRFHVQAVCDGAVAEQGMRASLDSERPLSAGGTRHATEPVKGVSGNLMLLAPDRRLYQLGHRAWRRAHRPDRTPTAPPHDDRDR